VNGTAEITGTKRKLEVVGLASPAHSNHDVMAFLPELGLAIVGDVLVPGRCPNLTDPSADLAGMLAAMDLLQKKSLRGILASGGGSSDPAVEIEATRAYAKRLLKLLFEMKQENVPPAKIASHIRLNPIQGYCAGAIDTKNAVALYERMTPEGKLMPGPGAAQKGPEKE
jgi:glyoxylase-like metal-dependent hydrolase (beta-lactamase superfamily II)